MFPNPFHSPVHYKEVTTSTMDDARSIISRGEAEHGCVCRAGFQSAGRGRIQGRTWDASPGENLLFTLILEQNKTVLENLPLSLSTGVFIVQALEKMLDVKPLLKWPNDIYLQGKKICGILCEARSGFYLTGIGLNINQSRFHPDIAERASSLAKITGAALDVDTVFKGLLESLYSLSLYPIDYREVEARLYGLGQQYTVDTGYPDRGDSGSKSITGTILGINTDGSLRLNVPSENGGFREKAVYSGEIVVSG